MGSRRSRPLRLLLSAVLVTALSAPVHAAGRGSRGDVNELVGVNAFRASTTASTLIRFPRPVHPRKELNLAHFGNGRVQGVILAKVGKSSDGTRPTIQNVTLGQCKKRGCKAQRDALPGVPSGSGMDGRLSGLWELYVIADGAPVTVVLEIAGLRGSSFVRVNDPVRAEIKTLTPRVDDHAANVVHSTGDFTTLDKPRFGLVGMWVAGANHVATASGDCLYHAEEEDDPAYPPEPVAFLPGCPTGEGFPFLDVGPQASMELISSSYGRPIGLGAWFATASQVSRHGAVALWVAL